MKFHIYLTDEQIKKDTALMIEAAMFFDDGLNEGIGDSIKKFLPKLGLHVDVGPGLIQQVGKASKNVGQLLWYAFKNWATNDKEALEKAKELANTQVTKEDFVKFIFNLDKLTLHLITGPLKIIDGLTGWHIDAAVKSATSDLVDRAKATINNLKTMAKETTGKIQKSLVSYIHAISRMFGFPQEKGI